MLGGRVYSDIHTSCATRGRRSQDVRGRRRHCLQTVSMRQHFKTLASMTNRLDNTVFSASCSSNANEIDFIGLLLPIILGEIVCTSTMIKYQQTYVFHI